MAPARPSQRLGRWANGWLAHAQVAVQGKGLAAERHRPKPATLAEHNDHLVVQVEVAREHDPGGLSVQGTTACSAPRSAAVLWGLSWDERFLVPLAGLEPATCW
jgi:hypothetical protein